MGKLLDFLKGKKTYVVALAAILTAVGAWLSGAIGGKELVEAIFAAIAAMTMRAGISKSGPTA